MNTSPFAKNISIHYQYTLLLNLGLVRGVWMIYLASRGFTLLQLGILEATFHIVSFFMEVPTGSVADLWGRKTSRIAGRVVSILSLAIMFHSQSFALQLIGFAISALGYNLESGAGDALVYDSLLAIGREDSYMKVLGRQELIAQGSAVVAFLIGGYLALHSYAFAFGISMAICLAAALLSLGFTEPPMECKKDNSLDMGLGKSILFSMKNQIADSAGVMVDKPRIGFLILFSELLFAFMVCLFFYLQNFWTQQGFSERQIGIVFAVHAIVAGFTSFKAVNIERTIGQKGVLVGMPLLLLLCLWAVALSPWAMVSYIMTGCIEGILIVTVGDYLNRLIPSTQRATILSFQSMAFSTFMIALFPLVGWIGDRYSLHRSFLVMSVLGTLLCIPYLVFTLGLQKNGTQGKS
ncbi:MAG: MFS transporter [Sphaerochaeta sp.]|nr:MFS transporter [Sphaerochaeta sp.]